MLMKKQHSVMFSTDRTNTNAIKICNEDILNEKTNERSEHIRATTLIN